MRRLDDWYDFAFRRLTISGNQTPLKWELQVEGSSIEIGNFRHKLDYSGERGNYKYAAI
jgi:hypothetical protein